MEALEATLQAKNLPGNSKRIAELRFAAAIIGENQSRTPEGDYFDKPRGDWILVKIFLPKDGDDGEVFFNCNPVLGKGDFSLKDSDYGDYLLKEFAKVC